MTCENKDILRNFMREVWNEGREDAVDNYIAPQYTIHHDPGDPWHGQILDIAGFKKRLNVSRPAFPDQCFSIEGIVAEGNKAVATWLWRGTHLGETAGVPPTGRVITMSGITVYYFEKGKISGHWQVIDRLGVFQQLTL